MLIEKWAELGTWSPLAALKNAAETKWLIDGVIPAGSINWLVAPPQSLKTFVALDMATCIANGRPWHGRETDGAVVLYLAAEGGNDIHVRRAAMDMVANDTGPLCIAQMRPRLDEHCGLATLLGLVSRVTHTTGYMIGLDFPENGAYYSYAWEKYLTETERARSDALEAADDMDGARAYGIRLARPRFDAWDEAMAKVTDDLCETVTTVCPKLAKTVFLVIDTYSQTSADDVKGTVSAYIKTLRDLQDKATALGGTVTVLVVDHTTKSGESYMGSLAKEGDSDTMLELDRHGNSYGVTLKCAKMKMAVPFAPIHLELCPFVLEGYTDALGRPLTSLIVGDGEQAHKVRRAAGAESDTAAAIVLGLVGESSTSEGELRRLFTAHPANAQKKAESVSRTFRRALDSLTAIKAISVDSEGAVRIAQEPETT